MEKDALLVYIHVRDPINCQRMHSWIKSRFEIEPISPPFGYLNSGVLELEKDDYISLLNDEFFKTFIEIAQEHGLITKVIIEE